MSANNYTRIIEVSPNWFILTTGFLEVESSEMQVISESDDLKATIIEAKNFGAEYGPYFDFINERNSQ